MSYREIDEAVSSLAGALAKLGVQMGDRVGILLPNSPPFIISYYGVIRLGAIVVQLSPMLTPHELQFELQDSQPIAVITIGPLLGKAVKAAQGTSVRHIIVSSVSDYSSPFLRPILKWKLRPKDKIRIPKEFQVHSLEHLLAERIRPPKVEFDPKEHIAVLQYTGGTTGISKAAMLTHFNLVANTYQINAWLNKLNEGEEINLCVLPFFHVYGMTTGMLFSVFKAAKMVLLPRFNTVEVTKAIAKYKVTVFCAVPSMYISVAQQAEQSRINISSVKACVSGGAPLPKEVHERFVKATKAKLVEGYGLSEASPVTHINPVWDGENRIGTIGLPVPDTDCKIVDLETGERELNPGEAGELIIKGPQVMKGYWNRPEETAQTLRNGWLYTGDIATMDEDGYFRIVDRKKDMIIVDGLNVYPREVEEVLYQHPKVLEAAVIGIPHPVKGQVVKAFVTLKPNETATKDEIINFCRQMLAKYKVPFELEFPPELPKSIIGKVLRRQLKAKELGDERVTD